MFIIIIFIVEGLQDQVDPDSEFRDHFKFVILCYDVDLKWFKARAE